MVSFRPHLEIIFFNKTLYMFFINFIIVVVSVPIWRLFFLTEFIIGSYVVKLQSSFRPHLEIIFFN